MLTQAARCFSINITASLRASSSEPHVVKTTILSVTIEIHRIVSCANVSIDFPRWNPMRISICKILFACLIVGGTAYGITILRAPRVPGEKLRMIEKLEKENEVLHREIEE